MNSFLINPKRTLKEIAALNKALAEAKKNTPESETRKALENISPEELQERSRKIKEGVSLNEC